MYNSGLRKENEVDTEPTQTFLQVSVDPNKASWKQTDHIRPVLCLSVGHGRMTLRAMSLEGGISQCLLYFIFYNPTVMGIGSKSLEIPY